MLSSTPLAWHPVNRWLHWIIALLIAAQAVLGWVGHEMARSPAKVDMMVAHKSLGVTLVLLVVLRLVWRVTHPVPPPPAGSKGWEIRLAQLTHIALYLAIIGLPLSGWMVADTSAAPWKLWWVIPLPSFIEPDRQLHRIGEELHELLVTVLIVLLVVHTAAALYHHFVKRDDVLLRMLGRD
ncbi:cytochrome b [Haliea sp. E17]|uniref:cytochrome b n=1 Tax=Haliea sp. E17 TaxID=3401576 RepID=UPI003AADE1D1